jgi:chaperone modulatory protein CbpM
MRFDEILVMLEVEAKDLSFWVQEGWIVPLREAGTFLFTDVDIARARLIRDLRRELEIDAETMPLVLSLLDQLYGARRQVRTLMEAIQSLPEEQQAVIRAKIADRKNDAPDAQDRA